MLKKNKQSRKVRTCYMWKVRNMSLIKDEINVTNHYYIHNMSSGLEVPFYILSLTEVR